MLKNLFDNFLNVIYTNENIWRWYPWLPWVDSEEYHEKEKAQLRIVKQFYKEYINEAVPNWFILDKDNKKPLSINEDTDFFIPSQKRFQMLGELGIDFYPILVEIKNFQINKVHFLGNHYLNEPPLQVLAELKLWLQDIATDSYDEKTFNKISVRIRYLLLLSGENYFSFDDRNYFAILSNKFSKIANKINHILMQISTKNEFKKLNHELKVVYGQSISLFYFIFRDKPLANILNILHLSDVVKFTDISSYGNKNSFQKKSTFGTDNLFYESLLVSNEMHCRNELTEKFKHLDEKYSIGCRLLSAFPNFIRQVNQLESMAGYGGDILIYFYLNGEIQYFLKLLLTHTKTMHEICSYLEIEAEKIHRKSLQDKYNLESWNNNYMYFIKEDISPLSLFKNIINKIELLQLSLHKQEINKETYWKEVTESVNSFRDEINLLSNYLGEQPMIHYLPNLITNFVENKDFSNESSSLKSSLSQDTELQQNRENSICDIPKKDSENTLDEALLLNSKKEAEIIFNNEPHISSASQLTPFIPFRAIYIFLTLLINPIFSQDKKVNSNANKLFDFNSLNFQARPNRFWTGKWEHCYDKNEIKLRKEIMEAYQNLKLVKDESKYTWFTDQGIKITSTTGIGECQEPTEVITRKDIDRAHMPSNSEINWDVAAEIHQLIIEYQFHRGQNLKDEHLQDPMMFLLQEFKYSLRNFVKVKQAEIAKERAVLLARYLQKCSFIMGDYNDLPYYFQDRKFLNYIRIRIENSLIPQILLSTITDEHNIIKKYEKLTDDFKDLRVLIASITHFGLVDQKIPPLPASYYRNEVTDLQSKSPVLAITRFAQNEYKDKNKIKEPLYQGQLDNALYFHKQIKNKENLPTLNTKLLDNPGYKFISLMTENDKILYLSLLDNLREINFYIGFIQKMLPTLRQLGIIGSVSALSKDLSKLNFQLEMRIIDWKQNSRIFISRLDNLKTEVIGDKKLAEQHECFLNNFDKLKLNSEILLDKDIEDQFGNNINNLKKISDAIQAIDQKIKDGTIQEEIKNKLEEIRYNIENIEQTNSVLYNDRLGSETDTKKKTCDKNGRPTTAANGAINFNGASFSCENIVFDTNKRMSAARETLSYRFFRGLVLSKNLLIQTISSFAPLLISGYPAEKQLQAANIEITDTFHDDFHTSPVLISEKSRSLYKPEFNETSSFQGNIFSDSHQPESNTAMQESSEILQHGHVTINEVSQRFTFKFFKPVEGNSNALCLFNECQPEPTCDISVRLTSLPNQTAAYSSQSNGIYHLSPEGNTITVQGNCQPQHFEIAFDQTVAQLPDYEQQQWQQTFFNTSYQLSLTASHSATITAASLFAEDLTLACGYSPETAAWLASSARYTAQGAQMTYDIYQGADAVSAVVPLLAANAVYYGLISTTNVSNATATMASTITQYSTRAVTQGFLPTACSFFASTAGSITGSWLEQKTANHFLSEKLKENFQKRLEIFTEKANAFYISLEELKAQGLEKIAEDAHLQINPIIMNFYNQTAEMEGILNFALYRQLCHVDQLIDETNHKILSFDKVTSNTFS